MATSIRPVSIARDVAELMKANRRVGGAIAASQVPVPAKDRLVITTNGQPATWQLSALPYLGDLGSSLNLSLNGLELDEATDYTVDYTTGLVTFSAGQQALFKVTPSPADVLTADYQTSDDLIAQAQPGDSGGYSDNFNRANASTLGSPWVVTNETGSATPSAAGIDTNQAKLITSANNTTNVLAYVDIQDNNQDVSWTMSAVGFNSACAFRVDPSTRGYWYLYVGSGPVLAYRRSGSFSGSTHSLPAAASAGDVIRVVASGTSITVYKNGVSQLTITDTFGVASNTAVGIAGIPSLDTTTRFDNFVAVAL